MYIYSVKSRVNNEIVSSWEAFFLDEHLDDLVNTGCFTHYEYKRILGDDPMSTYYVADYYFETMEDLNRYNELHAAGLKQDVVKRFSGKFQSERSIYQVLNQKNQ